MYYINYLNIHKIIEYGKHVEIQIAQKLDYNYILQ